MATNIVICNTCPSLDMSATQQILKFNRKITSQHDVRVITNHLLKNGLTIEEICFRIGAVRQKFLESWLQQSECSDSCIIESCQLYEWISLLHEQSQRDQKSICIVS